MHSHKPSRSLLSSLNSPNLLSITSSLPEAALPFWTVCMKMEGRSSAMIWYGSATKGFLRKSGGQGWVQFWSEKSLQLHATPVWAIRDSTGKEMESESSEVSLFLSCLQRELEEATVAGSLGASPCSRGVCTAPGSASSFPAFLWDPSVQRFPGRGQLGPGKSHQRE